MFCKFCGNKIVPSAFSKCSFCGARIDLFDGGQSFFKDAEVETWKNDGLSSGPDTGMPRTEIKEIEEKRIPTRADKEEQMNPMPSKLSLKWIAGTIAFVLLLFGIVANLPGKEKQDIDGAAQGKETWIVEFIEKVKKSDSHHKEIEEQPAAIIENKDLIATYTVANGDVIEEEGVTLFNVTKFLTEEEGYKLPIEETKKPDHWGFELPGVNKPITINVAGNQVFYRNDKNKLESVENILTKKEDEKIFVDAEEFLDKVFGYSCEYDPNTQTLKIYD